MCIGKGEIIGGIINTCTKEGHKEGGIAKDPNITLLHQIWWLHGVVEVIKEVGHLMPMWTQYLKEKTKNYLLVMAIRCCKLLEHNIPIAIAIMHLWVMGHYTFLTHHSSEIDL